MGKDTTAFRERFNAYKNGKSVSEIYDAGLPRYVGGKPAYQTFIEDMGPVLFQEMVEQGVKNPEAAYRNMITLLAYESNYGQSRVARELNNFGGVGWNGKTYTTYKDKADFVRNYVRLMNSRYKNVIAADTLYDYAKGLKGLNYYEDSVENYTRNLTGMKSFAKALDAHMANNPDLYVLLQVSTKPMSQTTAAELNTISQFQPWLNYHQPDYPLNNPAPSSISSWNNPKSPAYTPAGLQTRRIDFGKMMMDMLEDDWEPPAIQPLKTITPPDSKMSTFTGFKNGKLPGYKIGHNVSNAKLNEDGTFTDDYTKVFEDMYVTPQKTDLKRGSYTLNNFPYYLQHRTDWIKPFMSSATNEKGLERVYPEFDLLFGGRQITTSLLPKKPTAAKIKTPVDKYTLDWLNWSRGGDISPEHLKEYSEIIKAHKDTPSWLLMDDGSYFRGDPRSWVLLMSESAKKAGLREGRFPSYTNIGYSGVDRTIDPQYTGILWFSRNPLTGRSFARNDAHVLEMAYPWPKHVSTVDAGGNYWPAIFKTDKGRLLETNDLVNFSVNPKSPLEIKNVYELGPNFVLNSKYKTPDFNYGTSFVSDDIILYPNYPRKSILYNNGEFDLTNRNMYYKDGKLPFFSNGKTSIHIKPANRGKFNATKKRTGKTTEELAHSKNPLTRKRAIFALNARKWKH